MTITGPTWMTSTHSHMRQPDPNWLQLPVGPSPPSAQTPSGFRPVWLARTPVYVQFWKSWVEYNRAVPLQFSCVPTAIRQAPSCPQHSMLGSVDNCCYHLTGGPQGPYGAADFSLGLQGLWRVFTFSELFIERFYVSPFPPSLCILLP